MRLFVSWTARNRNQRDRGTERQTERDATCTVPVMVKVRIIGQV